MDHLDENLLVEHLHGRLSATATARLLEHLDLCEACRQWAAAAAKTPAEDSAPGTRVERERAGRYVLLSRIGSGGMGVVYAALDPALNRRVALKLLIGSPAHGAHARLLREGQVIAQLNHPNVVSVYDVGEVEGQPFIAMEHVEGGTLESWLVAQSRTAPEIVRMFLLAGEGLAAAHAAGIVHRDFKPSNVLVGDDGRVRVTDFGLAGELGVGVRGGTPVFMSPEQREGREVDARSDQFSFCLALTGALPPKPPLPTRLVRALERGMAHAPVARFASMRALLDALDASLRPRRAGVIAAVSTALALCLLALVASKRGPSCESGPQRLAGVWDEARQRQVREALERTGTPHAAQTWVRIQSLLSRYSQGWSEQYRQTCEQLARGGSLEEEEALSLRLVCLTRRRSQLRALTEVLASTDASTVDQTVAAAQALPSTEGCLDAKALRQGYEPPADEATRVAVERLRETLDRSRALVQAGRYEPGLSLARGAERDSSSLGYPPARGEALLMLGTAQRRSGDLAGAGARLEESVAVSQASHHDRVAAEALLELFALRGQDLRQVDAARALLPQVHSALSREGADPALQFKLDNALGVLNLVAGEYEQAVGQFERLAATPRLSPYLAASVLANRAVALHRAGQTAESAKEGFAALQATEAALGPDHPRVATVCSNLAIALDELDRPAEALAQYERAVALRQTLQHPDAANSLLGLGVTLVRLDRLPEALKAHERALEVQRKAVGPDHASFGEALQVLAFTEARLGRDALALEHLQRALAIQEKALGAAHPNLAFPLHYLAHVLLKLKRPRDALGFAQRAVALREKALKPGHPLTARSQARLAEVLLALGRTEPSIALFERALTLQETAERAPTVVAVTRFGLAKALRAGHADPARVRHLATLAKEALLSGAPGDRVELAEVTGFLAKR